ncbi:hypothetical protein N431DRAFT_546593 [Stipitochalara longipes BDJ]|nr:hypothetical protein N431DRAFT_546593 [Stipitochalara longipes BDJ]
MTASTRGSLGRRPPFPTKQALGDRSQNTIPDDSSTLLVPPNRLEKTTPKISSLTSNPSRRTMSHTATEKNHDLNIAQPSTFAPEDQQTMSIKLNTADETSFTLFPKLAPELRRMIWSYALSGLQIIELRSHTMNPRVREPIVVMAVCHEAREVALESYNLVKLGPTISTPPFYFSSGNSICLLKDEASMILLRPLAFEDKSHPWNTFREQVTTLAVDPLLCYVPRAGHSEFNILASAGRAIKLAIAVATLPGLKEVIILRRMNFEQDVAQMAAKLPTAVDFGKSEIQSKVPYSVDSWRIPPITYLDYEYNDGEDAWEAMRKALLAHRK